MEAVVLAGGFGTRLRHIVSDVPKPMSSVCGKPFLEHILTYLKANGVTKVVLAVGYMKEKIINHFGNSFHGLIIEYSIEESPLLTGGAIKKAFSCCDNDTVFVINGDTYFDVDLRQMLQSFINNGSVLQIAVKQMNNFNRYGTVEFVGEHITKFCEKQPVKRGYINGGIYVMKRSLLDGYNGAFSFEIEVMEKRVHDICINAFFSEGYFIDIGIPEDYAKAQKDFKMMEKNSE